MITQLTKSKSLFELIKERVIVTLICLLLLLYSHIFSFACNMFSKIYLNIIEHIQKLEILYEFDVRFHTKARKFNLSCFTNCTKHASAGALIHRQQAIRWIFTQIKLSSIYRHKPIVTYWAWKKHKAYNLGETQTCKYFF